MYVLRHQTRQSLRDFRRSQVRERAVLHDFARVDHAVQPQWGSGGRGFKSRRPDLIASRETTYGGFGRRKSFRGPSQLIPQTLRFR